nr:BTAD domain-containing putative transcriptional regulator [Amycolatopsis antarctica]
MSALRRILRDDTDNGESYSPLFTKRSGYGLELKDDQVDIRQFERELVMASHLRAVGSPEEAIPLWRGALRRWASTPFAGIEAPFVEAERARLTTLWLAAIADLAETSLNSGSEADVLDALTRLEGAISEHPLHERLAELRIRILNARGRRADALAQFERTSEQLAEVLGIEPGDPLRDARREAIAGPATPAAAPGSRRSGTRSTELPPKAAGFVGRNAERTELFDQVAELAANTQVVCSIDGAPGVGKTALALEFAHQAGDLFPDGCHYVDLRGRHGTKPPITAAEALRVLLESVGGNTFAVPDGLDERIGAYHGLMADKRALVLLDDAREIGQVRPLLAAGAGTMVVITSRRRLGGLVARDGAVRISLDVLPRGDAVDMLAESLPHTTAERDAEDRHEKDLDELAHLCGDLPLALSLAADQLHGMPYPDVPLLLEWLRDRRTRLSRLSSAAEDSPRYTLEEAFFSAYSILDTDSAALFVRLGKMENDTTAAAAAAATGWTVERARHALEELAMASLLDWGRLDTYHIPPLVHLYAGGLRRARQ